MVSTDLQSYVCSIHSTYVSPQKNYQRRLDGYFYLRRTFYAGLSCVSRIPLEKNCALKPCAAPSSQTRRPESPRALLPAGAFFLFAVFSRVSFCASDPRRINVR